MRVDDLLTPQIHFKFRAKDKNSDELVNYIVQDLPEDRFEDALQFMLKYFPDDEPMFRCKDIGSDEISMKLVEGYWKNKISEKVSLVCFRENSDEIVGLNVLFVETKESHDRHEMTESERLNDILEVMNIADKICNVFEHYNVNKCLSAFGLLINRKYRGCGIGTALLKARKSLMNVLKIELTTTVFSGIVSQTAAKNAGFEENVVLEYENLHKIKPGLYYPGIEHKYFKKMSFKI